MTDSNSPGSALPNAQAPDEQAPEAARAATKEATLLVADTVGELMNFWNFKPSMGQVWAVLYLSQDPLDASEIAARTGLSAGSVSMTLAELLHWGVVQRAWRAGKRRKLYQAQTDIVAMVTHVFAERELRVVSDAIQRLERSRQLLDERGRSHSASQMLESRFLASRVDAILSLARVGHRIVDRLATAGSFDLGPLREVLVRR